MARQRATGSKSKANTAHKPLAPLDEEGMQRCEAYLARGRHLEKVETAVLKSQWVAAFRRAIANFSDLELARGHQDIQAELRLRGEDPPFAEVEKDAEAFFDQVRQAVERAKRNPEQYAEMAREMGSALQELAGEDKKKIN